MCVRVGSAAHARLFSVTGWRRHIRCLKLQVIFRKRATDYRALLREMTCKDKTSYGSSPPCTQTCLYTCTQEFKVLPMLGCQRALDMLMFVCT